jgi:hypothetical protein
MKRLPLAVLLCAPEPCYRYCRADRQVEEMGVGTNHIGFSVAFSCPPGAWAG